MKALIVIDLQNDFSEGGPLAYKRSIDIIPKINRIRNLFDIVIFTKDNHPDNHSSFKTYGGNMPPHCIQGTDGAEINQNIIFLKDDYVITKGTLQGYDSTSAFYDAEEIDKKTKLDSILKRHNINNVYLCGTGMEHCIFSTGVDCNRFDYKCTVIKDCVTYDTEEGYDKCKKYFTSLDVDLINSVNLLESASCQKES